ncbi:alpha-tocopherol transfer protein-like [Lycorma delicatula]|uniref:alpha-tocopherol transfer protein-like n=1 Tax=Lycorma delicatula TaxID=130591 RepID=UPI003F514DE6
MNLKDLTTKPITTEEEYKKNPDLKKEDIEILRQWVKSQSHLPSDITEKQLILFYHSCYYDFEATKSCINVYYKLRASTPEFFSCRRVDTPESKHSLKVLDFGCLPEKDPNGNQIIFHRLHEYESGKYVLDDGIRLLIMAFEACLYVEGTVPGYTILFDMKGVGLGHLMKIKISSLKKLLVYVQEGLPIRLKAIHVMNSTYLVSKIMMILKPFMKPELIELIHFHTDMEPVYEILTKKCLPKDYGGDLPPVSDIHEHYCCWMKSLQDYFEEQSIPKPEENKSSWSFFS